jgi:hypothetical protein
MNVAGKLAGAGAVIMALCCAVLRSPAPRSAEA